MKFFSRFSTSTLLPVNNSMQHQQQLIFSLVTFLIFSNSKVSSNSKILPDQHIWFVAYILEFGILELHDR